MTTTSKETGLTWSEGADLVKSIPATETIRDRQFAGMLTHTATSETDLRSRFSSLGTNDYRRVRIPSLKQTWEWDGKQWIIFDNAPVRVVDSSAFRIWKSGEGGATTVARSGELWFEYQRMGRTFKWSLYLKRADDSDKGVGTYYFNSPVPVDKWWCEGSSAWIRAGATWEIPARVVWVSPTSFRIVIDKDTALGTSSYDWQPGHIISAQGEQTWVGGYK